MTGSANTEIERKFLVANDGWREYVEGAPLEMRAGYLARRPGQDAHIVEATNGFAIALDPAGKTYSWPIAAAQAREITDLGLLDDPRTAIRIRFEGEAAMLTVKGRASDADGRSRPEFNWPIPAAEADEILSGPGLSGVIRKTRWPALFAGAAFTVDVFSHPRPGLVLAEIELADADDDFARPDWLGPEVTSDPAWSNMAIAAEAASHS